jgi:phosphoserine phosphatase
MKYRLVLFDVDSTLIEQEVIDLLGARASRGEEVSKITAQAMAGELNFDEALKARVALLKGLPESVFQDVLGDISFTPGAESLIDELRRSDYRIGVISGGFLNVLDSLLKDFHLNFVRANSLEVVDGYLTGQTIGTVINRSGKAQALKDFAQMSGVQLSECVAVGDGSNDLDMIQLAGLGVSYRGKEILNQAADVVIEEPGLDQLLKYL